MGIDPENRPKLRELSKIGQSPSLTKVIPTYEEATPAL